MKKIIFLFLLLSLNINVYANDVQILLKDKYYDYKGRNDIVMVLFYSRGNVDSSMGNIKQLMKTRDPGGFLNPYWIINFVGEAVDEKTGCGLVFGQWYQSGYPVRGAWEDIMESKMNNYAETFAYFYASIKDNGDFSTVVSHDSHVDSLKKICKLKL